MISSGLQSISLQWNPSKSTNYRVQIHGNDNQKWQEAVCYGSMAVASCVVESNMATVKGLRPSSVYFFRIKPAGGTFSPASEAMKTRSLGRYKHRNELPFPHKARLSNLFLFVFIFFMQLLGNRKTGTLWNEVRIPHHVG